VAPRSRIAAFGAAGAMVVAGALCAVLVEGVVGQALALALITLGLGAALLLVFYEVGLSEDRERAREEERRRRRRPRHVDDTRRLWSRRRPRRPGR
jgi:uncharacterized membrane protein YebE (DUF533 family)